MAEHERDEAQDPAPDESDGTDDDHIVEGGPDITKLAQVLRGPFDIRSFVITGLFVLAVVASLYAGGAILIPIALATILSVMLHPIVSWLRRRLRIPMAVGSALVIGALLLALTSAAYGLSEPAANMIEDMPERLRLAERKFRSVRESIEGLRAAGERVEEMADIESDPDTVEVRVREPTITRFFLGHSWAIAANFFLIVGLLYFLLASDDLFLLKLVRAIPKFKDKKLAVDVVHHIKSDIAQYFLTITVINICLGGAVGLSMWMLGLRNPVLWGVMAAVFNFIPFAGAIVGIAIVALASITQFDTIGFALIPPAAYLALTSLEGSFVTPMVLGHRLVLNPVVIFVSLIFWAWLWGVPGIFLAVPIMSAIKIMCDNIEPLRVIGEFLGR